MCMYRLHIHKPHPVGVVGPQACPHECCMRVDGNSVWVDNVGGGLLVVALSKWGLPNNGSSVRLCMVSSLCDCLPYKCV